SRRGGRWRYRGRGSAVPTLPWQRLAGAQALHVFFGEQGQAAAFAIRLLGGDHRVVQRLSWPGGKSAEHALHGLSIVSHSATFVFRFWFSVSGFWSHVSVPHQPSEPQTKNQKRRIVFNPPLPAAHLPPG